MSPKRRALLIASPYGGLRGPENDVDLMANVLSKYEFEVTRCCGHDATRAGILNAWRMFISEISAGDIAVIYYSGYGGLIEWSQTNGEQQGVPEEPLRSQFLVPMDFNETTEDDFRGILDIEISYILRDTTNKTKNVTVILECCHAARTAHDPHHNDKAWPRNLPEIKHHSAFLDHVGGLRREGHLTGDTFVEGNPHAVWITAAAASETAWEYQNLQGQPIGVFTEALAAAMDKAHGQQLSWRTVLLEVCEFVNRKFPQQHPRVEGPDTRILFSTEHIKSRPLLIRMENGNAIIQEGRVAGIHEGSIYGVMPFGSGLVEKEKQVAEVKVKWVDRFKALVEITSGSIPREGALAFLQEALAKIPVSFPDDPPALGVRVGQSIFIRRFQPGEERALVSIKKEGERMVVCKRKVVLSSYQFTDATMQAAIDAVIDDGERLARSHHFLTLESGEEDERLDHAVEIEFGLVGEGKLEQNGMADVTENKDVYIKLHNGGHSKIFVSIFDVDIAGRITLVSESSARGIELTPQTDYMLEVNVSWPRAVSKDVQVEETLVFVMSSEKVDLMHLADPELSFERVSSLERTTRDLKFGQARDLESEPQGRCIRYAVHRIPFLLHPQ
ncbi:hypothetical protein CC80DRAFT_579274 [Byssothecium circinans]|uniref:Peptidase C14 caspase domain-containing protein n=1 Tax=Byssothecium circinans TaxID=147558 RepID=A0A6A5TCG6_9PLEO|nr:hypothetical protein CC80DRAFT_579274 [Byssothecium circinans]